jgi:hypothetical protein
MKESKNYMKHSRKRAKKAFGEMLNEKEDRKLR